MEMKGRMVIQNPSVAFHFAILETGVEEGIDGKRKLRQHAFVLG
jgi:hypothetical protein